MAAWEVSAAFRGGCAARIMMIWRILSELLRPVGGLATALPVALAGHIQLVERRGRKERLDPKRQVEISTLLESIPEAAVIVDARGRVIDANTAAAVLVGMPRNRLLGARAERIAHLLEEPASDRERRNPVITGALQGHIVRQERRELRNPKTGISHELLVSANPVHNDHGEVIAALIIARDVTELSRLQHRMGDLERHHAIGQMASALAHDFNNILSTISQAATVLEMAKDRPPAEQHALIGVIQKSVRRGADLVRHVRDYIRTGQGALSAVDLPEVIEETVELTRPLWEKANIKVVTQLAKVPRVKTNSADMRRVFTNLIINAIEAMPKGGEITITCETRDSRVLASVSDTGAGIPLDQQKKIFYPYFTTKPKGTGLGLSGAQKILLSQGGNITFRSEPGQGATFTIVLPALENDHRNHNAA